MKSIDVAVGIILDASKSKVLIAKRNSKDEHLGQWEFPGGKIESDELANAALKRELKEELGITISKFQQYTNINYRYPHRNVKLKFYLITQFSGIPKGMEGQKIKWQDISKLQDLEMLEANREIIKKLLALMS